MGRSAKSTRGGNHRRVNPGRLRDKLAKKGMSEHAAEATARSMAKLALRHGAAAAAARAAPHTAAPPRVVAPKSAVAHALRQLQQSRRIADSRTAVVQAQRRRPAAAHASA